MIIPYRVATLTMRPPWANLALGVFGWIVRFGTFDVKGDLLITGWFAWDLIAALRHVPGIACWAQVGGTLAGFGIGVLLLKMGRIHIGEYDNPTVLDLFSRSPE